MIANTLNPPTKEEINDVLRNRFRLDLVDNVVSFELILREKDPVAYDRMRASFEKTLATHARPDEVLRRSYVSPAYALHLECVFPRSEIRGLQPDMALHYPVCTVEEILRMQNPSSAEDQLLLLRANAIADNSRLKRVFLRRRERQGRSWSLTSHFSQTRFQRYLNDLPQDKRLRCAQVPAGFAFLREPNGACVRTDFGDLIMISEALEKYLYFMNIFLFESEEVPESDRLAALLIASRTMLLLESPDFDLDPRGHLPVRVHRGLKASVDIQMQFVIGHEYGHLLLKHLDRSIAGDPPIRVIPGYVKKRYQYYTPKQTQELAADVAALLDPILDDDTLLARLTGAIWFFLGLELFYGVMRFVQGSVKTVKTHPPPVERIWALYESVRLARPSLESKLPSSEDLQRTIDHVLYLKGSLLTEFLPKHRDKFEFYGSMYLASFRRAVLTDRFDY